MNPAVTLVIFGFVIGFPLGFNLCSLIHRERKGGRR